MRRSDILLIAFMIIILVVTFAPTLYLTFHVPTEPYSNYNCLRCHRGIPEHEDKPKGRLWATIASDATSETCWACHAKVPAHQQAPHPLDEAHRYCWTCHQNCWTCHHRGQSLPPPTN